MEDGTPPGALLAATLWTQSVLLGRIATLAGVIAVASVGLLLLSGRLDLRRGARVIAGCFILFGASSIAAGLLSLAAPTGEEVAAPVAVADLPPPVPLASPQAALADPYAGASVHAGASIF